MKLPLEGVLVLEFAQYLSGPCAGLRLADLGARVIKIEHPEKGEAGRKLSIKNLWLDDSSLLFNTINRNKESFAADMNNAEDMETLRRLIARAHVLIHNFRPGVMEKRMLDYESVKAINPSIVYTQISGYGSKGPWAKKPGQDLLVQALSGLAFTTGSYEDNPTPLGLGIGDYLCGNQAVQFILAALIRSRKNGKGTLLELSLLESLIDLQFEFFTTYFASGKMPERAHHHNAHSLLSAPYGIYKTSDGFIAIAMMSLQQLNKMMESQVLTQFSEGDVFSKRDEIKVVIADLLLHHPNDFWIQKAQIFDLWIMPVLNWKQMKTSKGYQVLEMEQEIASSKGGKKITTTRCPIRINNKKLYAGKAAPALNEHTQQIKQSLL
ncbi:CaiB/BaiF CoA transferase family protein [Niabella ginsengisoli]|uniref:CoA transferase n=1 Tax=Niabella ginsengisoli TaxID=522298 RepID=A0ABS9SI69_9BACT|nr:CaiB/BaiF CoA-transferase family protein [Niabella ginsengisoli]MCH5598040.1 CoA transferase [Niabella ginsengisoli]